MATSSYDLKGCLLALANPLQLDFTHIQQYLNKPKLLCIRIVVKGWQAVSTIDPDGFNTLVYARHKDGNGKQLSHLHSVVPYDK